MSGVDSAEPPRSVGAGFAGAGAGIDWCTVPAGPFAMGRDAHDAFPPDEDERPRRLVSLAAFRISRVPVTKSMASASCSAVSRRMLKRA